MEGDCSGTSERSWTKDEFADLLLPWSVEEIFYEDPYKLQDEGKCELCPQNTHSESGEWSAPGTGKTLTLSDSDWEAIVYGAKDRHCFFNADENPEIEKAIIVDAKKELNQLNDLLSAGSALFKDLRWQVLFSHNFRKSFQKLKFSSTKKWVINLLLKLARGWRPRKVNVDWKCENSSYIIKQFKADTYYVVCSIDLLRDSVYKQVLKVWDILPMTDTAKLLKQIDSIASMYTDDFINHCNKKLSESIATESFSGDNNFTGVDDVNEISEFIDIPDTFVGIRQKQYPLITTFHKFLMMLDGTVGKSYFQRFPYIRDSSVSEGRWSVALQNFLRKNEVTYDRFSSIYWPHFNAKLTKTLDASRVFTEIISHIKGGRLEGEECDYKRSRQGYISLSESRISTLCVEQRDAIYDIFEDYEKMKLECCEFDLADFVSDIHLRLNKEDFPGDKMDFVYIDEVQDLTMRQISLFRYICNNVDEGFVFSGDTAQTIARGIDFRFEDIRSLFYKNFILRSQNFNYSGKKEKGLISDMFSLSFNFRTHSGVIKLAQTVVDLICHFFPTVY